MDRALKQGASGQKALGLCTAVLALCLLAQDARAESGGPFADRLQACAFRHPVSNIPLLADLPAAVRAALLKHGAMADKGENFNSSDAIILDPSSKMPTLPQTRFMRAGQWQNLVYVWYEAGGIALFHRLATFRLDASGAAKELSDQFDGGHDPCALTDATLDGKPPS